MSKVKENVMFQKLTKHTFTLTLSVSRFDSTKIDSTTAMMCEIARSRLLRQITTFTPTRGAGYEQGKAKCHVSEINKAHLHFNVVSFTVRFN